MKVYVFYPDIYMPNETIYIYKYIMAESDDVHYLLIIVALSITFNNL